MSIFTKVWAWIKGAAVTIEEKALPIAIAVTEGLQTAFKGGTVGFLAKFVETVFPQVHNIPEELVAAIQKSLPKVLAVELGLEALADGATEQEIAAFEESALDAFGKLNDKSKLYSEIAAQVFTDTVDFAGGGQKHTYAEKIGFIEAEFQKIKTEIAEAQALNL